MTQINYVLEYMKKDQIYNMRLLCVQWLIVCSLLVAQVTLLRHYATAASTKGAESTHAFVHLLETATEEEEKVERASAEDELVDSFLFPITNDGEDQSTEDQLKFERLDVESTCVKKLKNIENVHQFRHFVSDLKVIKEAQDNDESSPVKKTLRRCLDEYPSMRNLSAILAHEPDDVCSPSHIRTLINYHIDHIEVSKIRFFVAPFKKHRKMVRHFFTKYAHSVAYICRKNMLENLRESDKNFTDQDMYEVLKWRHPEAGDQLMREMAVETIESIENIDELELSLPDVDRFGTHPLLSLPDEQYDRVMKTVSVCKRYHRHFSNAIMSIVRLGQSGYRWRFADSVEHIESPDDAKLVHKWIAITAACVPQLYSQFKRHERNPDIEDTDHLKGDKNSIASLGYTRDEQIKFVRRLKNHVVEFVRPENLDDSSEGNPNEPKVVFGLNRIDYYRLPINKTMIKQSIKYRSRYDRFKLFHRLKIRMTRFHYKLFALGPPGSENYWSNLQDDILRFLNPKTDSEMMASRKVVNVILEILSFLSNATTVSCFVFVLMTTGVTG